MIAIPACPSTFSLMLLGETELVLDLHFFFFPDSEKCKDYLCFLLITVKMLFTNKKQSICLPSDQAQSLQGHSQQTLCCFPWTTKDSYYHETQTKLLVD